MWAGIRNPTEQYTLEHHLAKEQALARKMEMMNTMRLPHITVVATLSQSHY